MKSPSIQLSTAILALIILLPIGWTAYAQPCSPASLQGLTEPSGTMCSGSLVTLTVQGNLNGAAEWRLYSGSCGGELVAANSSGVFDVYPKVTTNYYVRAEGGCLTTLGSCLQSSVIVHPAEFPDLGQDIQICPGESRLLDAGEVFTSYEWSNGNFDQTTHINSPGTYSVTVEDVYGCYFQDDIVVTNYVSPGLELGANESICSGESLVLTAGNDFTAYQWSQGGTLSSINISEAGVYSVTAYYGNNCSAYDEVAITVNPAPVFSLGSDRQICENVNANLEGPSGNLSYLWSTGATSSAISVESAGTYELTVRDENNCAFTDGISITISPSVTFDLGDNIELCPGQFAQLDAGADFASYEWNTGPMDQMLTVSDPGTYAVTVEDAYGCYLQDEVIVTQPLNPGLELGPNQNICAGESIVLSGGDNFSSYSWSQGGTQSSITVTQSGTYSLTAYYGNNCNVQDEVTVVVHSQPVFSLGNDLQICPGSSANLIGPLGQLHSYLWSTGETSSSISVSQQGIYSLHVTDINGCAATDEISVSETPAIVITESSVAQPCGQNGKGIIDVNVSGGFGALTYDWSNDGSGEYDDAQDLSNVSPGDVTLTVRDQALCEASKNWSIIALPLPIVDAGQDVTIQKGESFVMQASAQNAAEFEWTPASHLDATDILKPVFNGDATTEYILTATGLNGCTVSDHVLITVLPASSLIINNIVTPNNDGINDTWLINDLERVAGCEVEIFNRWGKRVFKTSNYQNEWNGKSDQLPEGTYFYSIKCSTTILTGSVSLVSTDH